MLTPHPPSWQRVGSCGFPTRSGTYFCTSIKVTVGNRPRFYAAADFLSWFGGINQSIVLLLLQSPALDACL